MIYRIREITRDARRAIDENRDGAQLIAEGDEETLSLEELIESKIEEGARLIGMRAPLHLLEEGHNFGEAIHWEAPPQPSPKGEGERRGRATLAGWTLLPDDFMRLIDFRMSDWERTCHEAMLSTDGRYALQSSRYAGIRGTPQKPVVAIVSRPEGKALEFYSCRSEEAYAARAHYLPYPKIDANGGIDISERTYRAVVYMTASLALTAYGQTEGAQMLAGLAEGAL